MPSQPSPISPVATSTSTPNFFKQSPRLIRSATTFNRPSTRSNYLFTIEIPENASTSLETVTFIQQSNLETITFYSDQFSAFLGNGNSKTKIPIKAELTGDNKIKIIFLQPIPSGNTVTISLSAINPTYGGVYQFSVTAFPLGNNSQGLSLGVGRLHFLQN